MSAGFSTLTQALAEHARHRPDSLAVRFIEPGGASLEDSTINELSYRELDQRAASVAARLSESAEPGDRAVLVCQPGIDYIAALYGCFYAGVVAVPAYPPTGAGTDERLRLLIDDSDPRVLLTTTPLAEVCRRAIPSALNERNAVKTIKVDRLDSVNDGPYYRELTSADGLALLQYTSGSTGAPRGVMLRHSNVMANVQAISECFDEPSTTRSGVIWLPPYHDMGLIGGIFMPLVTGFEVTLMSPLSFLTRPLLWLEAITKYRGTVTAAPNFAYELCVRKVDNESLASLDLSSLRHLINGAEQVRHSTIQRFSKKFGRAGFRRSAFCPAYGLAEATLVVAADTSLADLRRGVGGIRGLPLGRTEKRVSVGVPIQGGTVLVVDPTTCTECADGKEGEIWCQGPSVSEGYWNNRSDSEATFRGKLADDVEKGEFLHTGDLGVMRGRRLHVTGRRKDLIIVNGRNYHPHDIEDVTYRADHRLRPGCGAAFEVSRGGERKVVLVAELVDFLDGAAGEEVWENVRRRVARDCGIRLNELILIERGSSLKTSSGKIRRRATRDAYLAGELAAVGVYREAGASPRGRRVGSRLWSAARRLAGKRSTSPAQESRGLREQGREELMVEMVRAEVAAVLGQDSSAGIDVECSFKDLGLDSLAAVELRDRLQVASGMGLATTVVFDHPSIGSLARHLLEPAGEAAAARRPVSRGTASEEPIAIVGMSCRYPGADSPAELGRLLAAGREAIGPLPDDRGWNLERLYDPDPEASGSSYAREGGFLADAAGFDAEFFGISPREALAMDPQQRLLLEGAWEALEDAGIDPVALRGAGVGVFAGAGAMASVGGRGPAELEGYRVTGTAGSVASGRIAYTLGLEGPAISVDTACSSSLVAMHLAMQALRGGECEMALAGGVTVLSGPDALVEFSRQRVLSPDGRCKAFAEGADGIGWGEGVGMLVLERLSEAERNGHTVLATIRGSAVNQDGASNGLTAPNGPSQERVIRQALANAGLTPSEVDAVEAHGTGTALGDPIEAGALLATYGQEREEPLYLGSVKSNIGHTQLAAGAAGVIKSVLAMREGTLPKTLHVDAPSSKVDWDLGSIELLTEAREWKPNGRPRRIGVSSFGISGTNAHLILEEPPTAAAEEEPSERGSGGAGELAGLTPLLLSAKSPAALQDQARRLAARLRDQPELDLPAVAASLATTRSTFERRAVAVGEDRDELLARLEALARGEAPEGTATGSGRPGGRPVFLFPGQGSQWVGMGAELAAASPTFDRCLDECEEAFAPFVDFSVRDVVLGREGAPSIERVEVVQPALFATTVSLARLWEACGVLPGAVVGHSQGEVMAACVAGALSLSDAARLVALRGRLISTLVGSGAMISVSLPAPELEERISRWQGSIEIAARNGPRSTVLSVAEEARPEFLSECEADGVRVRTIPASAPSHSAFIDQVRDELLGQAAGLSPRSVEVPFYSTVGVEPIDTAGLDAEYWYRNMRRPVEFERTIRRLLDDGRRVFVEVSPHPVFALAVGETIESALEDPDEAAVLGTLRREEGGPRDFAGSLAQAHAAGAAVDWKAFFAGSGAKTVPLPTYPFQRKRYWLDASETAGDPASLGQHRLDHALLGAAVEEPDGAGLALTGRLSLHDLPWLADHALAGTVLLPGAALLDLALRAGEQAGCPAVAELTMQAPLVLSEKGSVWLQVSVGEPDDAGRREVSIHSRPEAGAEEEPAEWTCHARGIVAPAEGELDGWRGAWPPPGASPLDPDGLYERLAAAGLEYGPAFQGLESAWGKDGEIYVEVALAEEQRAEAGRFAIHPALLDAALHGIAFMSDTGRAEMPFSWSEVRGSAPHATLRGRLFPADGGVGLELFDQHGAALARVGGLALRPADAAGLARSAGTGLLAVDWQDADLDAVAGEEPAEVFALSSSPVSAEAPCEPTVRALDRIQAHLAADGEGRLAILTAMAVAAVEGESPDPSVAAAWGLVRSAQAEHPGRFLLVDSDGSEASEAVLGEVLAQDTEPQLALRRGRVLAPRAVPVEKLGSLAAPSEPWRLETTSPGSLDGLELVADPHPGAPLSPREVRVEMRAAGLNFRDVVVALGLGLAVGDSLGSEGAGVVVEVGAEVDDLAPGDRVVGFVEHAFAPLAVAERALLAPVPAGWSFERAAAIPSVFGTARHGLEDLAGLHEGERVLIHAAAGGVGLAAIQVARRLGAEIYATAGPAKWSVLEAAGISPERIASSRDTDFAEKFLAATDGEGVDVVLNSLAGEFVDASLRLLPRGGRFLEMGKTDIRDAREVGDEHPGVAYRAFDLPEAGPESLGRMLDETLDLLESGAFEHSPVATWDVREARAAFRHLREGRNVGKVVLTIPRRLDPERTVLIVGGTGGLGALVARHLVVEHGARRLLLAGRSGEEASGAAELKANLEENGAEVTIARCDVSSPEQLEALVASVPAEHPLGAVVHAAGALEDATIENLDRARVEAVFAPKADAARRLHESTASLDLSAFVLFSSAAGAIGSPGQGNYAAANAYLDALALQRRRAGLPATSIAWGLWRTASGMGAQLSEADLARLARSGVSALSEERGLALYDAALALGRADTLAIDLDRTRLRALAEAAGLPPLLRSPAAAPSRRRRAGGSLAARLAGVAEDERRALAVELVRGEAAAVLGHASAEAIAPDRAFKDLGFDSLAAVELRNRLQEVTGLRLATTAVFDYPSSEAMAAQLLDQLAPGNGGGGIETREREVRELLDSIPLSRLRSTGLLDTLLRLADENGSRPEEDAVVSGSIDEMDVEELIRATASGASEAGHPVVGVEDGGQHG